MKNYKINLVIFRKKGNCSIREYSLMQEESPYYRKEIKKIESKVNKTLWFRPKTEYTLELLSDEDMLYRDINRESFFKKVRNIFFSKMVFGEVK